MGLSDPIIMDNRKLRDENLKINAHFAACEKELELCPKEKGIISDLNYVDWINCPVCQSDLTCQWIVKWGGRYDECQQCSHIFVKNRLKAQILIDLYSQSEADQLDREVQLHDFNQRYCAALYNKYMSFFWSEYSKLDSILDVGCGEGQFIRYCSENGASNVYGLDLYLGLREQCKQFVPEENLFLVKSFEESELNRKFKIIFLWGVLEHLVDPNIALEKCLSYLEQNGKIFILIPNIHSRARRVLGVNTPTINPRQHINFFTYKSMEYVCHKNNLKIACFEHELPIIDLMWPFVHEESLLLDDINANKEGYYHIYILEKI